MYVQESGGHDSWGSSYKNLHNQAQVKFGF